MTLGLARCSLGHLGIVTDRKRITYPDGSSAVAWTGRHLLPLSHLGRRWSSRSPRWLFRRERTPGLRYAATARCPCGAGLAYVKDGDFWGSWDCSKILLGTADTTVQHTDRLPFAFYEIKSEDQPSAEGRTTRP